MQGLSITPKNKSLERGGIYIKENTTPLNLFRASILSNLFEPKEIKILIDRYISSIKYPSIMRTKQVERYNLLESISPQDYALLNTMLPFAYYATIQEELQDIKLSLEKESIDPDDEETYMLLKQDKEIIELLNKIEKYMDPIKFLTKTKLKNGKYLIDEIFTSMMQEQYILNQIELEEHADAYTALLNPLTNETIYVAGREPSNSLSVASEYLNCLSMSSLAYLRQFLAEMIAKKQEHTAYKNTYYDVDNLGFKTISKKMETLNKKYGNDFNFKNLSQMVILSREDIENNQNLMKGYKNILELEDEIKKGLNNESYRLQTIYGLIKQELKLISSFTY